MTATKTTGQVLNATDTPTESMQDVCDQFAAWITRHRDCCGTQGPDAYEAHDHAEADATVFVPSVAHRTRTFRLSYETAMNWRTTRIVEVDRSAKAECTCGWSAYGDDRADARYRAKQHRDEMAA